MSAASGSVARRWHPLAVFGVAFVVIYVAAALWSIATPLFASPDEPVQVQKAAAVDRGEFVGTRTGPSTSPFTLVELPAFYANLANVPTCYHTHPTVPASCAHLPASSDRPSQATLYNGGYPPLYYVIVGLPSLLGNSKIDLYLMRLLSALLTAVFLALAFTAAICYSRSRLLVVALICVTTPMVLFLGGVVNPSSLEISAAICAWTCAALIAIEHRGAAPLPLIVLLTVSAVVFEAVRALSPFWLALTIIAVLALAEKSSLVALWRDRRLYVAAPIVAVVGGLSVVWIVKEHATNLRPANPVPMGVSELNILEESFRHNVYNVPDMIGIFGWFDTHPPYAVDVIWYALIGVAIIAGAVVATRRQLAVIGLLIAAVLVLPVAISASQVHVDGYAWQGRDTLPFAVGVPIVALAILASRLGNADRAQLLGRLCAVVAGLAAIAQFFAFFEALRRYAVGTLGPDFAFLSHSSWRPPLGSITVVVLEIVVLLVGGALAAAAVRRAPAVAAPPAEPDPTPSGELALMGSRASEVAS